MSAMPSEIPFCNVSNSCPILVTTLVRLDGVRVEASSTVLGNHERGISNFLDSDEVLTGRVRDRPANE